jgi:hypothetical protein
MGEDHEDRIGFEFANVTALTNPLGAAAFETVLPEGRFS